MTALWRINLWVTLFFTLVAALGMLLLLRQASTDVQREMRAAQAMVDYLHVAASRDPASLHSGLTPAQRLNHWLAVHEGKVRIVLGTRMAIMTSNRLRHLPVVDDAGQLQGLISIGDLVKDIISAQKFIIEQLQHYISGGR